MTTIHYFAYGSNMLHERLRARVSTAVPVAVGVVRDYRIDFAKVSVDGSGKGDMVSSPGSEAWGVLYEMDAGQQADLDAHEGTHYEPKELEVSLAAGSQRALVYLAKSGKRNLAKVPYDWYLALVIAGARQNALPNAYIRALESMGFDVDAHEDRATRLEALEALAAAGMTKVPEELRHRAVRTARTTAGICGSDSQHASGAMGEV